VPPGAGDRSAAPGANGPVPGRATSAVDEPSAVGSAPLLDLRAEDGPSGLSPLAAEEAAEGSPSPAIEVPRLQGPQKGRRLVAKHAAAPTALTAEQRLLLLDTWQRSGLPAGEFAALVGLSKYTLYEWQHRFTVEGPAGLLDKPRGVPQGSRLPELTKRTILMLKQANPEWGCQRISDLLLRGPALPANPAAVARVLHEAGYQLEEVTTRKEKRGQV
jgi:transposase